MTEERNDLPEGYRMTELGPLPEEWEVAKAEAVLALNDSGAWGDDTQNGVGTEVLRSTNMQQGRWVFEDVAVRKLSESQHERYQLAFGDILVTKSSGSPDHIGKSAYVDEQVASRNACFSNFMQRLRFGEHVDSVFGFFFLLGRGRQQLLEMSTTTTGLRNLKKGDFEKVVLPLPPLPEQKKIALVLSVVQEAKGRTEAVIAAAKELKKSLMKYLFTYGPVPVDEAEDVALKETEIGEMPDGWPVRRLAEVCEVKTSTIEIGSLGEVDTGATTDVLVHGIKVADMNTPGNEREIRRAGIEVRVPARIASRRTVPVASVVFPKRGAAIATNKKRLTTTWTALDPNLIAVIPNADLDPSFLHAWFLTFDIASIQSPGPTPQLNKKDVEPVELPVPGLNLQRGVASAIARVDAKIEAEENRKRALEELFRTLLNELMTAKIRVNDIEVSSRPVMPMDSG